MEGCLRYGGTFDERVQQLRCIGIVSVRVESEAGSQHMLSGCFKPECECGVFSEPSIGHTGIDQAEVADSLNNLARRNVRRFKSGDRFEVQVFE